MAYVGIQTQQKRNNLHSLMLLVLFPILVLTLVFLFCYILMAIEARGSEETPSQLYNIQLAWALFKEGAPWAFGAIVLWFVIAYFANTTIISNATGSRPLKRTQGKRVYNIVENLCMSQGMPMPKINVINDSSLNAFASGINNRTFTVTLTTGIIEKLDDDELGAVIAHELSHIRNRDVRLLIVSIVFVGIFAMVAQIALRMIWRGSFRSKKDNGGIIVLLLVAALLAGLGYMFASLMRFSISRKREFLADAGSAEMTHNPAALASALRKISEDSEVEAITRDDVAQLFIEHPVRTKEGKKAGWFRNLFATHPPIEKRIAVLEQF